MKNILIIIDDTEFKYFEFNRLVTNFWLIREYLLRENNVYVALKKSLYQIKNIPFAKCYKTFLEGNDIKKENMEALEKGVHNLLRHVDNIKNKFGLNVIVAINRFLEDTDREIEFLQSKLQEQGINMSLVEAWGKGGKGAADLATKVVNLCENEAELNYMYDLEDSITTKIEKIATKIYGAEGVEFSEESLKTIEQIDKLGYSNLPVCIAKTQYSFSDDATNLECKDPFKIHVKDVILKTGAGFVVVLTGAIMTMPGLPKVPAAEAIDILDNGEIVGIF